MNETLNLRTEIAHSAARMIAEEGSDYASAKRRAMKLLLGNQKIRAHVLPDNEEIEQAVREYLALFQRDTQPQILLQLRKIAVEIMQGLERFQPYLVGAVLNGTANAHSDIYLHLFTDNNKDVAIFLLNLEIDFEVSETYTPRNESLETFSFMHGEVGVHLILHEQDAIRAGYAGKQRANLQAVQALLAEANP